MQRPWMPIYWGDYLADTGHLSTLEHGAYLLLIGHYWLKESLPTDDKQLARIARLSLPDWLRIKDTIASFFDEDGKHKRVEFELTEAARISEAGRKGGIASGKARSVGKSKASNDRSTTVQRPFNDPSTINERLANDWPTIREALQPPSQKKEDDGGDAPAWKRTPGYRIAKEIAGLCGEQAAMNFEAYGWKGAIAQVAIWLTHCPEEEILNSVREQIAKHDENDPIHSITFFENGLARHMRRINARRAIPDVPESKNQPARRTYGSTDKSGLNAIDRVFDKLCGTTDGGASAPADEAVVLSLPARSVSGT